MSKRRIPHRLKSKARAAAPTAFGVTWYTETEWSRVKAVATDPERFESSFNEWVAMAESALLDLHKAGIQAEKFLVNANDLLAWCLAHNKENNAAARAEFVSEQMRAQNAGA
jgi:hypothetical protein